MKRSLGVPEATLIVAAVLGAMEPSERTNAWAQEAQHVPDQTTSALCQEVENQICETLGTPAECIENEPFTQDNLQQEFPQRQLRRINQNGDLRQRASVPLSIISVAAAVAAVVAMLGKMQTTVNQNSHVNTNSLPSPVLDPSINTPVKKGAKKTRKRNKSK